MQLSLLRHSRPSKPPEEAAREAKPYSWYTDVFDGQDQLVVDEAAITGIVARQGRYRPLCGYFVTAAPLATPLGRSCRACTSIRLPRNRKTRSVVLRNTGRFLRAKRCRHTRELTADEWQ